MKLNIKLDQVHQHLSALDDQTLDHIDFDWEGIKFSATAEPASDSETYLKMEATLGRLYFTIEDSLQRNMALERLFQANRVIDGSYTIGDKGDIHFKCTTRCAGTLNTQGFLNAVTLTLLETERHLRGVKAHLKDL